MVAYATVIESPPYSESPTMSQAQAAVAMNRDIPAFKTNLTDEVTVTDSAHTQLKTLLDSEEEVEAVRIFVAGGGCSGMTYSMTFATERLDHDAVFEQDGLRIYVDAVALGYLEGVEIDYVAHATGASFVFNNVFQSVDGSGTCGSCGSAGGRA